MHQTNIADARRAPREEVNMLVKVRISDHDVTVDGELDNISRSGFLVWAKPSLDEGVHVVIVLDADLPGEEPIELSGVIVRTLERDDSRRPFGYGCEISV